MSLADDLELLEKLAKEFHDSAKELRQFRNLFVEQEDCALAIVSKPGKIQLLSPPDAWFAAANLGLEVAPLLPAIVKALRTQEPRP
jgi:hypothetical protein